MDDPSDELPFVDILQEVRNMTPYEKEQCLYHFMNETRPKLAEVFEELELEEGD